MESHPSVARFAVSWSVLQLRGPLLRSFSTQQVPHSTAFTVDCRSALLARHPVCKRLFCARLCRGCSARRLSVGHASTVAVGVPGLICHVAIRCTPRGTG